MIETPRFDVFKNKWKKRTKTVILEIVTSKKLFYVTSVICSSDIPDQCLMVEITWWALNACLGLWCGRTPRHECS